MRFFNGLNRRRLRRAAARTQNTGTELDHPEVYALRGGALLLICSNYGDTPPPAALGMFKTFPVYSASCTTYAQTFATARHLKAAIHAAGGEA